MALASGKNASQHFIIWKTRHISQLLYIYMLFWIFRICLGSIYLDFVGTTHPCINIPMNDESFFIIFLSKSKKKHYREIVNHWQFTKLVPNNLNYNTVNTVIKIDHFNIILQMPTLTDLKYYLHQKRTNLSSKMNWMVQKQ